jgi:hypothetical protein
MNKKDSSKDKLVTESYLDKKLSAEFDKNTGEIMDIVKDLYQMQDKKLDQILQGIGDIKKDVRKSEVRLDNHDVIIERLEKHLN